jgi:hypothetical protein
MILLDFIKSPCLLCDGNDFVFYYCRKYKEFPLEVNESCLIGNHPGDVITPIKIDIINNEMNLDTDSKLCLFFRIAKSCNCGHYSTSTNYIVRNFSNNKLTVPDNLMYDDITIRFLKGIDIRVPEEGGSINFINHYEKNETSLMTTTGWRKLPILSLNRFNLKNPIEVLNKIESLMVLL